MDQTGIKCWYDDKIGMYRYAGETGVPIEVRKTVVTKSGITEISAKDIVGVCKDKLATDLADILKKGTP